MPSAAVESPTSVRSFRNAVSAWEQAIEAGDADRIAGFYAQDVVAMYPRPSPTIGREANRQVWANYYTDPEAEHPITVDRVEVARSEDLGYSHGKYWSLTQRYYSGGRYLAVWELIEDQWQITMFSAHQHDDVKEDGPSRERSRQRLPGNK